MEDVYTGPGSAQTPIAPPALPKPPPLPPRIEVVKALPNSDAAAEVEKRGPTAMLWIFAPLAVTSFFLGAVMQFFFCLYALLLLSGVTGIPDGFLNLVNAMDTLVGVFAGLTFFCMIIWQGCAFGSLQRLYGTEPLQHGRGSGFWWLTPVANFFMPFQCLKEMRWFSRARRRPPDQAASAGWHVWLIEAALLGKIVTYFLLQMANRAVQPDSPATDPGYMIANTVNFLANATGLAFSLLLATFIIRNLIHQVLLYRHWNTAPQPAA